MSLASGARLGAYEILGPLGAGGMGEVYRARDTRLGREVAIKVLPADVAADPDRVARFEREAKAVSALNHPHIVTLYEVGTSEAGPYLVLEKIEGQSLRDLVGSGPLPVRRLVSLAAQIADGLAKAHSAGIVHRDLKPDNVMVTSDGFAKILDFGLAKLVWPELHAGEDDTTLVRDTASGMILGTLGYLSPEQAAGRPADERADQFALGALLYEMATRERLFRRETMAESLAATIRDEASPLRSKRAEVPQQFAWIVERCLAKDPNDRYASTKDLARDLADVRDRLSDLSKMPAEGAPTVGASAARPRLLTWSLAALGAVIFLAAGYFAGHQFAGTRDEPTYRALTFRRGIITSARFSPTDDTIYYSAAYGTEPSKIFITRPDVKQSKALDLKESAILLSVSRKGELAVLLTEGRNPHVARGTLARVSALGGTPRKVVENAIDADWTPDGEHLFVEGADQSLALDGRRVGTGIFPRVSPRGDRLAWIDDGPTIADAEGNILAREKMWAFGLAWAPNGNEVWFTGSESGSGYDRALFALSVTGKRRLIARAPGALTVYDVAPDGLSALVVPGAGWVSIVATQWKTGQEQSLDLYGRTLLAGLSADGAKLLLYDSREVGTGAYLRSTDGLETVPLGDIGVIGLTPNGDWALVSERDSSKPPRLQLVSMSTANAREIPVPSGLRPLASAQAQWSADGRRLFVLFDARGQSGGTARLYTRLDEGAWELVPPGIPRSEFAVSPDGMSVAARVANGAVTVFSIKDGSARPLAGEHDVPILWTSDGWLILREAGNLPVKLHRYEVATGRIEPWHEIAPSDWLGVTAILDRILLARDGRTCVYSYSRAPSDLYLAQGVR